MDQLLNAASDFSYFGVRLTKLRLDLPVYQNTWASVARQLARDFPIPVRIMFGYAPNLRMLCITQGYVALLISTVLAAKLQTLEKITLSGRCPSAMRKLHDDIREQRFIHPHFLPQSQRLALYLEDDKEFESGVLAF